MDEDKTPNAVRNLMRELNEVVALKAIEQELIQRCAQLQYKVEQKKKKLEHLNDVHKRKQQPKQIKTQKKQKAKNDTNATTLSSNITQEINIECDTSISQSNINKIQSHDNIDTASSTTNTHNFWQDENIQNAETENVVLLNEQQLETEALQKRTKEDKNTLKEVLASTTDILIQGKKTTTTDLQNDMVMVNNTQ